MIISVYTISYNMRSRFIFSLNISIHIAVTSTVMYIPNPIYSLSTLAASLDSGSYSQVFGNVS